MTTVAGLLGDMLRSEMVDATDVARVVGTSPRSVTRWATAAATPRRDAEERLLELKAVLDLLGAVLRDEPARLWLRSPNSALDYEKPIGLIQRGEYRRVIGAVLAVAEGVTTAGSAVALGRKYQVEMPISERIYALLHGHIDPQTAVTELMTRSLKQENA
jgi:hypothetical protein